MTGLSFWDFSVYMYLFYSFLNRYIHVTMMHCVKAKEIELSFEKEVERTVSDDWLGSLVMPMLD